MIVVAPNYQGCRCELFGDPKNAKRTQKSSHLTSHNFQKQKHERLHQHLQPYCSPHHLTQVCKYCLVCGKLCTGMSTQCRVSFILHPHSSAKTSFFVCFFQPKIKYNFRKEWLSDPSTYPLMLIMGGAMTFMIGMTANATFFYKGVYFDPRKRNSQMVTWGDTENHSVVERAVHWCSWQKNAPEGLGVNHNEWKKQKEEYFKEMENNEILE